MAMDAVVVLTVVGRFVWNRFVADPVVCLLTPQKSKQRNGSNASKEDEINDQIAGGRVVF